MNRTARGCILLVLALLTQVSWLHAQDTEEPSAPGRPIEAVRIQGNRYSSTEAVRAYIKSRVGQEYNRQIAVEDQRRLTRSGLFESVVVTRTLTDTGVILTYTVVERPVITNIRFAGNKTLETEELMKELPFGVGSPLSRFNIEAGRQNLEAIYKQGFHFVKISLDEKALADQREVVYDIVEGPRAAVRAIYFTGNEYFSTLRLRFTVAQYVKFWPIIPGYLDAERVDRDVITLRTLYINEGFLDVEVARRYDFSDDKTEVYLTYVIKEGPRYRINALVFRGNEVFSDDVLAGRLLLQPGDFFSGEAYDRDRKRLEDTYGELGYIEAGVQGRKVFKEEPGLVDLEFDVREGGQYTVGRIRIRGNDRTQVNVIRREIGMYPGQLWNAVAAEEARRDLLEAQLFGKVEVEPLGNEPGKRDVLVRVEETETGQFAIGGGINSNSGLFATVSLTQRNFDLFDWPDNWHEVFQSWHGAGQLARIVAQPGLEVNRFHVEWFTPYLFDRPYSLGTKFFLFTRGRDSYDEQRIGGVISTGHRFKNRWYGEIALRMENVKVADPDTNAPPEVLSVEGDHMLYGLQGTLTRDRTDSRYNPSKGDRFQISYEQVFGDWDFSQLLADYRIYRTLYIDALDRKHILAARVRAGHMFGTTPLFERYYGGGLGSIRGFEYRGVSPRSVSPLSDDAIGGDFMVTAGAEYTFPLVAEQVRGALFLDTGTVERDFEITTYRVSVGFGFRWTVPLFGPVPISFDFGFPLVKDEEDDTQIFSFFLGWTF